MPTIAFDSLAYFDKLKAAGVPEEQARIQADVFLSFAQSQEEKLGQDSVAKADLQQTELLFQKELKTTELLLQQELKSTELLLQQELKSTELLLRQDIQAMELKFQNEIKATELRLQKEIKALELRLLKWQLGIGLAIVAIMAKGFGWLGF